jgi:hypothetical protein
MDSSLWPAAIFGFVFVLLGVARLAKTSFELAWGVALAAAMALCVVFVSPVALVPMGLTVVAMGWWRDSGDLAKKRPPSPVQHIWNPNPAGKPQPLVLSSLMDGLGIGASQAQERGLVPWKPPAGTAVEQAEGLAVRAQRTNPFRPEGPMGHRTGLAFDRHTVALTGEDGEQGADDPEPIPTPGHTPSPADAHEAAQVDGERGGAGEGKA